MYIKYVDLPTIVSFLTGKGFVDGNDGVFTFTLPLEEGADFIINIAIIGDRVKAGYGVYTTRACSYTRLLWGVLRKRLDRGCYLWINRAEHGDERTECLSLGPYEIVEDPVLNTEAEFSIEEMTDWLLESATEMKKIIDDMNSRED
jgi:hypothetical protein